MKTLKINSRFCASLIILGLAILLSFFILARARAQSADAGTQENVSTNGITFPVAELGNCRSKDECKNYCNNPAHMDTCISFAKAHGLMNKDEADRAEKFRSDLANGTGPGGCKSPDECKTFCSDVKNIEACITFAESHGVKDKNLDQAKKVLDYMKQGGQTPGSCASEESCKQYCGDFSHAEECFNFAKKVGITQAGGGGPQESNGNVNQNGPNEEQMQKFLELAKSGDTPGGCKSKDECESYCKDQGHRNECVSFGEKIGFISHDQAQKIEQSGGKGPGGCDSDSSCKSYCNDQAHQEECFKFAEDHGFIKHDEIQKAKDGFVRLRAGLEQAPPEVTECIKSTLGSGVIDDIQSGKLTPGTEIGQGVKGCFEKFGHRSDSTEVFKNAPPGVLACLKEKLGNDFSKIQSGGAMPTPEMADTFRVCSQQLQLEKGNFGGPGNGQTGEQDHQGGQGQQGGHNFGQPPGDFLKHAPPGVSACLKEKLGDQFDKIQSGETQATEEVKQTLKQCLEGFKPQSFSAQGSGETSNSGGPQGGDAQNNQGMMNRGREMPPFNGAINSACVKQVLGDEGIQSLRQGTPPSADILEKLRQCQPHMNLGTSTSNQNPGGGEGEIPLFNKKPYPQSVPSFNSSSDAYEKPSFYGGEGAHPSFGGQYPSSSGQYQQPSGQYPGGGQYPSGQQYQQTSTYQQPTYQSSPPSAGSYAPPPSGGTYQPSPPPSGTTQPPPSTATPPSSSSPSPSQPPPGAQPPAHPPGANLLEILRPFLFFSR